MEISPTLAHMKATDALTPLERALLEATDRLRAAGTPEVHAYSLTKLLEDAEGEHRWVGYGSLYRALNQLMARGYFTTRWEDPSLAEVAGRPRRRLYTITPAGQRALTTAPASRPVPRYVPRARP
jgi:PadR family transcriptional regulator, regulatory protein PadR